jgi:hypothetical protein
MRGHFHAIVLVILSFALMGADGEKGSLERISMDFPYGETRLIVQKDGQAFLAYGALPQLRKVKKGTFDIDDLYAHVQARLHDNVPREKWPNPRSRFGMVQITWKTGAEKEYLIFDEESFASELFDKARKNLVDQ